MIEKYSLQIDHVGRLYESAKDIIAREGWAAKPAAKALYDTLQELRNISCELIQDANTREELAPALPEATVEGLFGKFVHAFDIALSNQIPTREDVWKQFLPAIQEVIAAERCKQHLKTANEDAQDIAAKDAEIQVLKERLQVSKEDVTYCQKYIEKIKSERDVLIGDNNRLTQQLESSKESIAAKDLFIEKVVAGHNAIQKQLEERKGMQWVKAKERLPEAGQTAFLKAWGSFEIGHYGSDSELFVSREENLYRLEDVEWLDESAPLPDSKQEAIAFAEWLSVNNYEPDGDGFFKVGMKGRVTAVNTYDKFIQHQQSKSKEGI